MFGLNKETVKRLLKKMLPQGFRKPRLIRWKLQNPLKVEHVGYWGRDEKARHVARRFNKHLIRNLFPNSTILDVGCDKKQLLFALRDNAKTFVYLGLDRNAHADIQHDIEKGPFPLKDNSAHTVVALDVLEHTARPTLVFNELVRCARRYIIVSLPNNWFALYDHMLRGDGCHRYYGLPSSDGGFFAEDRHKWFFNFQDADAFLWNMAYHNGLRVIERIAEWRIPSWPWWKRPFHALRLLGPRTPYYENRYFQTLWYVMEKP
jgi:hypothetical protein